jgi:hypothetical protein
MEGVRRLAHRGVTSPPAIAEEGNDVKCRRAIEQSRTDSISLAEAVRRHGVSPQLVQHYKGKSSNLLLLAKGAFGVSVKTLKRKNAADDDADSSSDTGSDDDATKANEGADSAYKQFLSAEGVGYFSEIQQREAVKLEAVDRAVWKSKKARLMKRGYMYLNKGVHYIEYNRLILGEL